MNAPVPFGHNETTVRLGLLAEDARQGLARVAAGEADAIEGWLVYGAALNEGRALHTDDQGVEDDRAFGKWIGDNHLSQVVIDGRRKDVWPDERAAAMWAAANPDQFAEARAAGNARTVRGIHAKWKEMAAEREAAEHQAEADRQREAEDAARREAEEAERIAREEADAEARVEAESRARRKRQEERDARDRREREQAAADRKDRRGRYDREQAEADAAVDRAEQAAQAAPAISDDRFEQLQRARGTEAERRIYHAMKAVTGEVSGLPDAATAARMVPSMFAHTVDVDAIEATAAWLNAFAHTFRKERRRAS